jgi:hypothetical protein
VVASEVLVRLARYFWEVLLLLNRLKLSMLSVLAFATTAVLVTRRTDK